MGDFPFDFERGSERAGEHQPMSAGRPGANGVPLPQPSVPFGAAPFVNGGPPRVGSAVAAQTAGDMMEDDTADEVDNLTNIYYLAQYTYQLSINAVTMSDHELGLLLPRSGRVWFNARLFSDVPHGRELATRDAWWRVIDSSPAVRFLLGWCVSIYRTAQFHHIAREQLPGWSRILYFSPALADSSRLRIQFWSDVAQDVTTVFAPATRLWQQIQAFAPMRAGEHRWQARLVMANQSIEEVVRFLADRNSCPRELVIRALDGNPALESFEVYQRFTEAILEDVPRLAMQRRIAMQQSQSSGILPQAGGPPLTRLGAMLRGHWTPGAAGGEQPPDPWHLFL